MMLNLRNALIFIISFFCGACLSYANSSDNKVEISVKTINKQLAKAFPFTKTYDGVAAVFSEPSIVLNSLDNTLKVNVIITTTQDTQILRANGQLVGKIEFYDFEKTLRIKRPNLDSFIVTQDSFIDNNHAVKVIKQSIGSNLPSLTLYNIENLALDRQVTEPRKIETSLNRLVLYW